MINWKEIEIGDVLTRNARFEKRENEKQYVFAGIYSFSKGVLIREPVQGSSFKLPFIQRINEGDFVYSKIMAWEGAFALVPKKADNTVLSDAFVSYTINREVVLPEFLEFYFKIESVWKQIGSKSTGTNMRRRTLHPQQFEKAKIRVPSINEQKYIVDKLNCITDNLRKARLKIGEQEKEIVLLRQSILQEAVQGKLTPQVETGEPAAELLKRIKAEKQKLVKEGKLKKGKELPPITKEEIPFELPEGWAWCRLGDIIRLQNGYAFQSAKYVQKGIRLVRNINIGHGRLIWDDVAYYPEHLKEEFKGFDLSENDILISLDRPIISSGLKIAKVRKADLPCLLLQRVGRISSKGLQINLDYLFLWFNSPLFIQEINPGRSNGVPHISSTEVENLLFPLPPKEEQVQIASKVELISQYISKLEQQITINQFQAQQLLQVVLKEAFAGKDYTSSELLPMVAEA